MASITSTSTMAASSGLMGSLRASFRSDTGTQGCTAEAKPPQSWKLRPLNSTLSSTLYPQKKKDAYLGGDQPTSGSVSLSGW
jgi:hypothetical protein